MRRFTTLAGALLFLAACTDRTPSPTDPSLPPRDSEHRAVAFNVTSETSTDLWGSIINGETGPGSLYALYMPRTWNGTVIYYGHGIRDVLEPVSLRNQDGFFAVRDQLGALGFAIAYSSFSENGYAIEDAVRRMHQLRGLFVSKFGQPTRSLLVGHSLGAMASLALAERFPGQYDGVVPICGVAGGTQKQLEYVVNVRALFDVFYPGLLPGSANAPVPGYILGAAKQQQIIAAVSQNPIGMLVIASTAQTPLEFTNGNQIVESLLNALAYHARGADNVLTFVNGKFPVGNVGVEYAPRTDLPTPLLPPALLMAKLAEANNSVARFEADPSAAAWVARNFTPSGALQLPTIPVHNRWDRLVPFFHEKLFADAVSQAGAGNLLVQRANPAWGYGHCSMPASAQLQAITDLAAWVETGVKPAS